MRTPRTGQTLCVTFLLCLVASLSALSQAPAKPPQGSLKTPADFPAEPYLIRSSSVVFTMHADGTGTSLQTTSVVIHDEAVLRQFSVISLAYASQSQKADFVYTRVTHADGTTQETPVASAIEQPAPVTQQAPLYSDLKVKQLPIQGLRTGDTLEWQIRNVTDHPHIPNQFWDQYTFTQGTVILDESVELRIPSGLHLTVWTNPRANVKPDESDAAGEHVYRWHHSDLKPTVGTEAEAAKKAEEKRPRTADEEVDGLKGALPSIAWSTFSDWASVGAWYRSLTADRITPDAAIRAKVTELTTGKATDLERAQAIYNYVSTQIRYVGVDFGIGRYQPHTAAEVFANQFGDCKDKHTLLASMLSVVNLHAEPVLIGAGIRFNSAVPSPDAFNHLISRLKLNGKDVWLDATAEIGAWGALIYPLRDHEALVVPESAPALIATTPADLPWPQTQTMSVLGSLDADLTSESAVSITLRNDTELYLRAALHSVSPAQYPEFVQRVMGSMGFGGTTSSPAIENLNDPAQPLKLTFHYRRTKEKDWGENRVTAAFQMIGLSGFNSDNPPIATIELGSLRTETSTVEMKLPEGWSATLPDAVHAHTAFANIDVTYRLALDESGAKLYAERRLTILKSKVPLADYKQYQTWYDATDANTVPYIQLLPPIKATSAAAAPAPVFFSARPTGAPSSDPKAASLVKGAFDKILVRDLDGARRDLDDAARINPSERSLWRGYTVLAQQLGQMNEAVDCMKHELANYPDETDLYPTLVSNQLRERDPDAALATLRNWAKIAPKDPIPPAMLAEQLAWQKHPADALREARGGIARIGPDADLTRLHIAAGNAEVDLDHFKEAAAEALPLLKSENPITVNDAAYILARAGANLDQAYTAEAAILATAEAEATSWTLADATPQLQQKESTLATDWDTMGWIRDHQGALEEAFSYCRASLLWAGKSITHSHCLTIANGSLRLQGDALVALINRPDAVQRTFSLGPSNGRHGVVDFTLLIAEGKVIDSSNTEKSEVSSNLPVAEAQQLLKKADLRPLFPLGSKAHLIRNGFVNCHSDTCELVLSPL